MEGTPNKNDVQGEIEGKVEGADGDKVEDAVDGEITAQSKERTYQAKRDYVLTIVGIEK